MEYKLMIGGIGFHIISEFEIMIEESYAPFLNTQLPEQYITVEFSQNYAKAPKPTSGRLGEDLLLEYYRHEENLLCLAKGGWNGPLAITPCDPAYSHLVCYLNTEDYVPLDTLGNLFRYLPLRRALQHYNVLFFHASQVAIGNTGILFTAPSGTGKTTQAKLWRKHRGARLICNDRTLVREGLTYGFPVDGSEPVASNEVNRLSAVVVLGQSPTNRISKLKPSAALSMLMPQLVIDTWSEQARELALDQLLELIQRVPVYRLECTPDIRAVECLEAQLMADEVI